MKYILTLLAAALFACSPDKPKVNEDYGQPTDNSKSAVEEVISNPTKGIGAVKTVTLKRPLELDRVDRGLAIYEMKCGACHKLTADRLVGPGWEGVTKRREPEWIMNMITNVDVMLDKDPEAQKLFELCLVRMPNQNISIGDARDILEFMRKNDGAK